MTILRATSIGERYRLGELLGRGGMADVFQAHDEVLGRDVAVKLLRNPADPGHRARFASEATTLAGLRHPHVVTLLDAGLDEDVPYLAMDLIDGRTLAQQAAAGALPPAEVRRVGAQVAAALAHAHAAGVVHRDVKPSNILLDAAGTAYLTDFGIARLLGSVDRHTRTDELVGSPAFLAPEQVEGGPITPAADIYSLGLVLLEVLTGQRAYAGSPVEAAIARLRTAPLIPTSLGPDLCRLLERMTRIDPAARPHALEVAAALSGAPGADAPEESASERTGTFAAIDAGPQESAADLPDAADRTTTLSTGHRPDDRRRVRVLAEGIAVAATVAVLGTGVWAQASSGTTQPRTPAVPAVSGAPAAPASPVAHTAVRTPAHTVRTVSTTAHRTAPHHPARTAAKALRPHGGAPAKGHHPGAHHR